MRMRPSTPYACPSLTRRDVADVTVFLMGDAAPAPTPARRHPTGTTPSIECSRPSPGNAGPGPAGTLRGQSAFASRWAIGDVTTFEAGVCDWPFPSQMRIPYGRPQVPIHVIRTSTSRPLIGRSITTEGVSDCQPLG